MKRRFGFILLELVIALSLFSALLLFSQQWMQQQFTQSRAALQLPTAQKMLTAIEYFWLQERRPPVALSELITKGYIAKIWQPWSGEWQLQHHQNMLRLLLPAEDLGLAERTSMQLPGAQLNAENEFMLHVFEPIQLALQQRYLHRTASEAPEYNQMEADLDMRGHAVRNLGTLEAERLLADSATLTNANFTALNVTRLNTSELIAEQANFGGYELVSLADRVMQLQLEWQQCRSNGGCQ